jgi:hypothetical protein
MSNSDQPSAFLLWHFCWSKYVFLFCWTFCICLEELHDFARYIGKISVYEASPGPQNSQGLH